MTTHLIARLQDESPKVKRDALQAILLLDSDQPVSQQVLRQIRRLLDDRNEDVRFGAVLAVNARIDRKATRALTRHLIADPDGRVRTLCAWALRRFNDKRAISSVIKGLKDRDSYVRSSCARAIGDMGSSEHMSALRQLFLDQNWEVRGDAAVAAVKLGDRSGLDILNEVTKDPTVPKQFNADLRRWYREYKQQFLMTTGSTIK
jgi:HEAT repeat protein